VIQYLHHIIGQQFIYLGLTYDGQDTARIGYLALAEHLNFALVQATLFKQTKADKRTDLTYDKIVNVSDLKANPLLPREVAFAKHKGMLCELPDIRRLSQKVIPPFFERRAQDFPIAGFRCARI
jgi:hypothetical protein